MAPLLPVCRRFNRLIGYNVRRCNYRVLLLGTLILLLVLIITHFNQGEKKLPSSTKLHHKENNMKQTEFTNKGMQVIVAHYFEEPQRRGLGKLTPELLNWNGFSPVPGEGEQGSPVYLPVHLQGQAKTLFEINKFNLVVSDRISLNRTLPDMRKQLCRSKNYNLKQMHSASIIIVFHNEAWSTLLRTIYSIINTAPHELIREIILVDDASNRAFLKKPLEEHVKNVPVSVRIVRMPTRAGLIRSRVRGASLAQGKILLFLDAHCECTKGWLEPLLLPISENRTRVLCPIIDVISDDTFAYIKSFDVHWGAINWALHFRWLPVSDDVMKQRLRDYTQPFKTPVMAGGLFAIDKSYFTELGQYDPQMNIWGGENIELSLKVWMCGGTLEISPCSHVGHIFRKGSPYPFPGGVGKILYTNLARVAEVWLDDWKYFFYKLNPAEKIRHSIDDKNRQLLRDQLKCHNFQWYLETVWPQHFFPTHEDFFGQIQNNKNNKCLQRPRTTDGSVLSIGKASTYSCLPFPFNSQLFIYTTDGYIKSDESVCLGANRPANNNSVAMFVACSESSHLQWEYSREVKTLVHKDTQLCLSLPSSETSDILLLQSCQHSLAQSWIMNPFYWSHK